ncbi:hypothetical protein PUNSTDRAFT_133514 [Punctularia strigosozonata HHB-11173 SS5]|uniref:uncharacterized protein n=1 Tax=Punctularia strigosozonata (strain HHB-11173) TaxID=741275 RepID=UPI00044169E8|nr:uncharacterized protein PUNSTDRAFT_133514 [Punctularia strigosozonata HHB-11173 SS5]EIN09744.1 hypothetical protein PUNSTDRAFT_133514 [Punctularia strigosozonata HHB-11173 SS5]
MSHSIEILLFLAPSKTEDTSHGSQQEKDEVGKKERSSRTPSPIAMLEPELDRPTGAALAASLKSLPNARSFDDFDTTFRYALRPRVASNPVNSSFARQRILKVHHPYRLHHVRKPTSQVSVVAFYLGFSASTCPIQADRSINISVGLIPSHGLGAAMHLSLIFRYTNTAGRMSHDPAHATNVDVSEAKGIMNKKNGWYARSQRCRETVHDRGEVGLRPAGGEVSTRSSSRREVGRGLGDPVERVDGVGDLTLQEGQRDLEQRMSGLNGARRTWKFARGVGAVRPTPQRSLSRLENAEKRRWGCVAVGDPLVRILAQRHQPGGGDDDKSMMLCNHTSRYHVAAAAMRGRARVNPKVAVDALKTVSYVLHLAQKDSDYLEHEPR